MYNSGTGSFSSWREFVWLPGFRVFIILGKEDERRGGFRSSFATKKKKHVLFEGRGSQPAASVAVCDDCVAKL